MTTYRIVTIPGDGIGPEILSAALEVLDALQTKGADFRLDVQQIAAGAGYYRATGKNISDEDLQACRQADGVLKAPVGLPDVRHPDGTEAGLLGGTLRLGLDLYANVRPVRLLPGVQAPVVFKPGQIDYVIVRENTEGLYASRGLGVANNWAASDILFMTRPGVERVVRFAFDLARKRQGAPSDRAHRVTCVAKSNVLKSFAFFHRIFEEIAEQHPDIQAELLYSDAAAQALVLDPSRFDVLVMENFLGDLLSDLGGGTVGGIGMCPSGNFGERIAYFEPVHGSAPSLAGQDRANPLAQVLSAAMLLDHLGQPAAAEQVRQAIWRALESGALQIGPTGSPKDGTRAAARAIVDHL